MKKQITVPTSLNEITLSTYQYYTTKEEMSNEELISLFCNITQTESLQLPNSIFGQASITLANTFKLMNDDQVLTMRFKLNGIEYGMIPNLDEISYGENKDLTAYLQDWKTMHLAMSVLFRPIDKSSRELYSIEKYSGTKEHRDNMKEMPLDIVLGAQQYFYKLTEELLKCIPSYLQRVMDSNKEQMPNQTTTKLGQDMTKCIISLKETLEDLMK